ncbi:MAG TPA: IS1595 family transposase [Tepidisphaeraceae bacterium]|nr:IS1595 family transposase [Tepidisphaeraceae bacterium]
MTLDCVKYKITRMNENDKKLTKRPELKKSPFIDKMPKACNDETAAVELFEDIRWGDTPGCVHCGSVNVYKMMDAATGGRSKRFLWRCRDCRKQYTVRIGTVYNESRLPLRHWAYAFWRASTSKKGVAAMEIMRHCQITYKTALFLMHRIRFALKPSPARKMTGTVEIDETYCGGKPRPGDGKEHFSGRGTSKTPVLGLVERDGNVHRRVIANITGKNLASAIREVVDASARIMTDENNCYTKVGREFSGGHHSVNHSKGEYVRGDATTNTIESSFAIVKRGLMGIHHAVSKKHLHRYLAHYDFLWNGRKMNDGDRTIKAIQSGEGKRLMYRPLLKTA